MDHEKSETGPNKAAEPMSTTGTPPADAGDRASGAPGSPWAFGIKMKVAIGITLAALLSSCQSPHLETPLENLAPSIVYPEASVYRLLAAPRELEGIQIRTYGFVTFGGNGETGFLFASRDDARERAPTNWIELTFSSAIAHKPWFRRFVTE